MFFNWPSPLRYGEGSSLKVSVDTSRFAAVNVKKLICIFVLIQDSFVILICVKDLRH